MEVIRGGNPDRFVKQYEGLTFVLNTPYQLEYPMMPEGPGASTVKCGWGYYNSWPAGTPGAFPLHDPEHLVCPDVTEWKKYVKAPDVNYTAEDWKPCQETIAGIDRNETMVAALIAPGVFEMCHYLCEIQNTMMNFYEEPEAMHELIEYITEWELKWAEQICTYMKPDVIFHCAAYTAVDKAEEEAKELDEKINVDGTRNVALAAKAVNAQFVYISTDYVFDGKNKNVEYEVDDQTNPLNEYGRTKLLGEKAVEEIFGIYGHNFVFTMQRLAETRDKLTVVNDQFGRPTWTRTLAEFMVYVIEEKAPFGIYHLSNENSCSWYEFAKEILKDTDVEVAPVTSEEFPQKATRPQYSVMSLKKTEALGFAIPTWQEALAQMLEAAKKMNK